MVRGSSDSQNAACCTANIFQVVSFIGLFPSALYPTYRFKEIFGGAHRFFGVLRHLHPRNDVQCNAVLRLQRLQKGVVTFKETMRITLESESNSTSRREVGRLLYSRKKEEVNENADLKLYWRPAG